VSAHVPDRDRAVSLRQAKPLYDRWRDAAGVHIPDGCRVEQVEVDAAYGALRSRLHKQGEVLGRTRSTRLLVRFEDEHERVSIRPHLLRVIEGKPDD
jgi:hypothetical protein